MSENGVSNPRKRPTLAEVALEANVSKSAASHAFNNRPNISDPVKKRVFEAAKKLNYVPNFAAKTLRKGQTRRIAVVSNLDGLEDVGVAERFACLRNFHVFPVVPFEDEAVFRETLQQVGHGQADGILILTLTYPEDVVLELVRNGYPVFAPYHPLAGCEEMMGGIRSDWMDSAGRPNMDSGFGRLLHLLYDLGHRQFGIIWQEKKHSFGPNQVFDFFIQEKGLEFSPDREVRSCDGINSAKTSALALLQRCPEITALICTWDTIAGGALLVVRELGVRVPDDLTVTGMGDLPLNQFFIPPITTITSAKERVMEFLIANLVRRIEGQPIAHSPKIVNELVVRKSSGPVRTRPYLFDPMGKVNGNR